MPSGAGGGGRPKTRALLITDGVQLAKLLASLVDMHWPSPSCTVTGSPYAGALRRAAALLLAAAFLLGGTSAPAPALADEVIVASGSFAALRMSSPGTVTLRLNPAGGPVTGEMHWAFQMDAKTILQGSDPMSVMQNYSKYKAAWESNQKWDVYADFEISGKLEGTSFTGTVKNVGIRIDPPVAGGQVPVLENTSIEGTLDVRGGKGSGTISKDPTTAWQVTFKRSVALTVEEGWAGVAADGKSQITLVAELPEGIGVDKADFKIVSPEAAAKGGAGGNLATKPVEKNQARATYVPPPSIQEPFALTIEATVTDTNRVSYSGSVKIEVVQPPVVLVHGVWSDPSAWNALEPLLNGSGFVNVTRFSYANRNNGDPVEIAKSLAESLPLDPKGHVPQLAANKIMASKYDLVGHSLGGLIIRQFVAQGSNFERVRKVVTLGTPHLGSAFANWFLYFENTKTADDKVKKAPHEVRNHANWKNGYRSWTYEAFVWLKGKARENSKPPLDESFFKYGPAVDALAVGSAFLKQLNSDGSKSHADKIAYYFLHGEAPMLPKNDDSANSQWWAEAATNGSNEVMVDTFFDHLTKAGTDGVVASESAKGLKFKLDDGTEVQGLPFKPKVTKSVSANHIQITSEGAPLVVSALKGLLDSSQPAFTYGKLESPAHLHAYDSQNRHVGLDSQGKVEVGIPGAIFSGPEAQTGTPETIVVPGGDQLRFEVKGYQEGTFGLLVRRSSGDTDREVSFKNVPIKAGQTASLRPESGQYQALDTPSGKVLPRSTISRPVEPEGGDWTGLFVLVAAVAVVGGGAVGVVRRVMRRRPAPAAWAPPAAGAPPAAMVGAGPARPWTPSAPTFPQFCGACGQPLGQGARFCGGCGSPAPVAAQPAPPLYPTVPAAVPAGGPAWAAPAPAPAVAPRAGGAGCLGLLLLVFLGLPCLLVTIFLPIVVLADIGLAVLLWMRRARISAVLMGLLTLFTMQLAMQVAPFMAQLTPYLQNEQARGMLLIMLQRLISGGMP